MNYLNGGYVMLDKADSDIFAKASGALQAGKPILWYEDKNTCYFIDTIEKTGSDSIALTKGGLTIVITSGNVVTEVGEVQQHLYEYQFTNDNNNVTFTYISAINCPVKSTDDSDYSQEELKSFYELLKDIQKQQEEVAKVTAYYDGSDVIHVSSLVSKQGNNFNVAMAVLGDNDIIDVDAIINDGVYSISNNTGYLYIDQRKVF